MEREELDAKLAALGDITHDQRMSIACSLIGHSRIITTFFGYVYCGRCGDQIGDTLAGAYSAKGNVIVGHNCDTCRENAKSLTWRDTYLAPDPFAVTAEPTPEEASS